jgi:maleate isomerase
MDVATGAEACDRALKLYGARRIGVITPYQPVADANVHRFFTESGYEIDRIVGLRCPTAVAISRVEEDRLREAILELDKPDVDAIVQVGTNLSMVRLADEAERWLGKPVIAINAATWWMALRANGFEDKVYGAGGLLREH